MVVIALSDIHGALGHLEAVGPALEAADLVILSGDLTMFGRADAAQEVVDAVGRYNPRIFAVMGNCDYPEVDDHLKKAGMSLHRNHVVAGNLVLAGLGGSLPGPVRTLNEWSEDEIAAHLDEAIRDAPEDSGMVLVSHQPPKDTAIDLAGIGEHVGSTAVRAFIEKHQPLVCFSGHIHEAAGVDSIGDTKLINPGPFTQGAYAYAEFDGGLKTLEIRRSG